MSAHKKIVSRIDWLYFACRVKSECGVRILLYRFCKQRRVEDTRAHTARSTNMTCVRGIFVAKPRRRIASGRYELVVPEMQVFMRSPGAPASRRHRER